MTYFGRVKLIKSNKDSILNKLLSEDEYKLVKYSSSHIIKKCVFEIRATLAYKCLIMVYPEILLSTKNNLLIWILNWFTTFDYIDEFSKFKKSKKALN